LRGATAMNLYKHWLLPRLIDLAMRNPQATRLRQATVPAARGSVLELGAGSGLNLPYYGAEVTELYALDPCEELLAMARGKRAAAGFPVKFLPCPAEAIALDSGSIDTVVSTWTLCSVADASRALGEARRVLRPGGTLIFVEHGLAPDAGVSRWQRRLNPLWRRIAGGCNLDRSVDRLVRAAGFEVIDLHAEYLQGPRPFTYTYTGRARRG
jgi:ubiquinone/menaquinone biosynthesis C-methylase UbiE